MQIIGRWSCSRFNWSCNLNFSPSHQPQPKSLPTISESSRSSLSLSFTSNTNGLVILIYASTQIPSNKSVWIKHCHTFACLTRSSSHTKIFHEATETVVGLDGAACVSRQRLVLVIGAPGHKEQWCLLAKADLLSSRVIMSLWKSANRRCTRAPGNEQQV